MSTVPLLLRDLETRGVFTHPRESFAGTVERYEAQLLLAAFEREVVDLLVEQVVKTALKWVDYLDESPRLLYYERRRLVRLLSRRAR